MDYIYTLLLNYFEKEIFEGKIDFRLRATKIENGVEFYIHPDGRDGETIDFVLSHPIHSGTTTMKRK